MVLGDFIGAFESFRKAIAHKPEMAFAHPFCHIADNVSVVAFQPLAEISLIVHEIKKRMIIVPSKSLQSHYTNLDALKKLAVGEKFRLYNADYMNDPEEGKTFWRIMNKLAGHNCYEAIHSDESEESHSPAYVGSFFRENSSAKKDGELFLWRTYGKHAEVEAAGACLYFNIQNFSDTPPFHFGRMHYPNQDSHSQEECIYNVVYANKSYSTRNKKLQSPLKNLAQKLSYISTHKWSHHQKKNVYRMTRELLDDIRFLFKANHYREERELRIVQSHYPDESGQPTADGAVEIDIDSVPPRFFVEVKNLPLEAVVLGPAARGFREWKQWIENKNSKIEVRKSGIRYGKRN
ncbi:MAG: DUF2971 domain-containing protein [Alphaproteobacteria bacterium]|nr:DUF2971 domain-containing protein [Alphaproteobacteria bacterium]